MARANHPKQTRRARAVDQLVLLLTFSLGGLAADCFALRLQGAGAWLIPAQFALIVGAPALAALAALSCRGSGSR
jgi:hypothetical protein